MTATTAILVTGASAVITQMHAGIAVFTARKSDPKDLDWLEH